MNGARKTLPPYRSILFVPAHKPDWAPKAAKSGADAVLLDLEDAVPEGAKSDAHCTVVESIRILRAARPSTGILVRPNGLHIVNSIFTLGLTVGIPVTETTLGTTLGNLAFEETSFPAPVFFGDTLRVEIQALGKRVSKSRPEAGIVRVQHETYNQDDVLVRRCRRAALFALRGGE